MAPGSIASRSGDPSGQVARKAMPPMEPNAERGWSASRQAAESRAPLRSKRARRQRLDLGTASAALRRLLLHFSHLRGDSAGFGGESDAFGVRGLELVDHRIMNLAPILILLHVG